MIKEKDMFEEINQELMAFLDGSPTSFHAVENMKRMLDKAGFHRLLEGKRWELARGAG